MSFVPFIPPFAASDRAQELARELEETVDRFRRRHPDMSAFEVRQALRLVRRTSAASARGPLLAVAIGVTVALGFALQASQRHALPGGPHGPEATTWMIPTIGVAVVLLGVLALVIARR
jgi:hypothetical protein